MGKIEIVTKIGIVIAKGPVMPSTQSPVFVLIGSDCKSGYVGRGTDRGFIKRWYGFYCDFDEPCAGSIKDAEELERWCLKLKQAMPEHVDLDIKVKAVSLQEGPAFPKWPGATPEQFKADIKAALEKEGMYFF